MKCLNECGKEAISKGTKPAKYCSDACRKRYKRTQDKKRTEQPDIPGPEPVRPKHQTGTAVIAKPMCAVLQQPGEVMSVKVLPEPHGCKGCSLSSYSVSRGMSCPSGSVQTAVVSIFEREVNPGHNCEEAA